MKRGVLVLLLVIFSMSLIVAPETTTSQSSCNEGVCHLYQNTQAKLNVGDTIQNLPISLKGLVSSDGKVVLYVGSEASGELKVSPDLIDGKTVPRNTYYYPYGGLVITLKEASAETGTVVVEYMVDYNKNRKPLCDLGICVLYQDKPATTIHVPEMNTQVTLGINKIVGQEIVYLAVGESASGEMRKNSVYEYPNSKLRLKILNIDGNMVMLSYYFDMGTVVYDSGTKSDCSIKNNQCSLLKNDKTTYDRELVEGYLGSANMRLAEAQSDRVQISFLDYGIITDDNAWRTAIIHPVTLSLDHKREVIGNWVFELIGINKEVEGKTVQAQFSLTKTDTTKDGVVPKQDETLDKDMPTSCKDSDGNDSFTKGEIVLYNSEGKAVVKDKDYCCDGNCNSYRKEKGPQLTEFYCDGIMIGSKFPINCEFGCSEGKCLKEKEDDDDKGDGHDVSLVNTTIPTCDGCPVGERCYTYFTRIKEGYCDQEGIVKPYVNDGESCFSNQQCKSGACLGEKCISRGFIESILAWFKKLFGSY